LNELNPLNDEASLVFWSNFYPPESPRIEDECKAGQCDWKSDQMLNGFRLAKKTGKRCFSGMAEGIIVHC
jgi:hypothetical protein